MQEKGHLWEMHRSLCSSQMQILAFGAFADEVQVNFSRRAARASIFVKQRRAGLFQISVGDLTVPSSREEIALRWNAAESDGFRHKPNQRHHAERVLRVDGRSASVIKGALASFSERVGVFIGQF